jgi:hypothetical protein
MVLAPPSWRSYGIHGTGRARQTTRSAGATQETLKCRAEGTRKDALIIAVTMGNVERSVITESERHRPWNVQAA